MYVRSSMWPSPCTSLESNDHQHGLHAGTQIFCSSFYIAKIILEQKNYCTVHFLTGENIDRIDARLAIHQIFPFPISSSSIANIHCLDAIRKYFPHQISK